VPARAARVVDRDPAPPAFDEHHEPGEPSTMAAMAITAIELISPFWTWSMVPNTADGRPATIPAKMISDTPLPTPRSVTCSPNHIRKMVPAVSATTAVRTKPTPGEYTTGTPPGATWFCSATAMLPPCTTASSTAPMREY